MSSRFYFPDLSGAGCAAVLPAGIGHHAVNVLRLGRGDEIVLFDGQGNEAAAVIEHTGKQVQVRIAPASAVNRETPLRVTLAQALPSGDKMDWIVEKCTELGVTAIQPVQAARSVVRLSGERAAKKQARWQEIAVKACAQCGRNVVPQILPVLSFNAWIATQDPAAPAGALRLLMDLAPDIPRLSQFDFTAQASQPVTALVGPEGAFSEAEIQSAKATGFLPVNLGQRILRTETAGLALMAALNTVQGDF